MAQDSPHPRRASHYDADRRWLPCSLVDVGRGDVPRTLLYRLALSPAISNLTLPVQREYGGLAAERRRARRISVTDGGSATAASAECIRLLQARWIGQPIRHV